MGDFELGLLTNHQIKFSSLKFILPKKKQFRDEVGCQEEDSISPSTLSGAAIERKQGIFTFPSPP